MKKNYLITQICLDLVTGRFEGEKERGGEWERGRECDRENW